MKVTKRLKVLLIIIAILLSPFLFYKLQGTRIHWLKLDSKEIGGDGANYFIIQNPPSSKMELIKLIEKMNDTLDLKSRVSKKIYYTQAFYEETFNLTRFYKPYYTAIVGTYINLASDNAPFTKEHLVDYVYINVNSNKECLNGDGSSRCPIYPYFIFYNHDEEDSSNSEYYPKGLKNDPNKRWNNIK